MTRARRVVAVLVLTFVSASLLYALSSHVTVLHRLRGSEGSIPPIGSLLDPLDGLLATARQAARPGASGQLGGLSAPVTVVRDDRNVPHIFASHADDAIRATGYVVAEDRLFQLDFLPRVAAGRLAEVFGSGLVETDRFLRSTGMEWGARMNLQRIQNEKGRELEILEAFSAGVNDYIDRLSERRLPLEFRLLGYVPERHTPLHTLRLLQYMSYDLSFQTDALDYGAVRSKMSDEEYQKLFPPFSSVYVPIFPEYGADSAVRSEPAREDTVTGIPLESGSGTGPHSRAVPSELVEGFKPGKGSNNWAVNGPRSNSGSAILAGDMHLSLWLPAIWYEMHVVTPGLNIYGVTIPGSPLIVEGFTDSVAWAFTNTGSDQIDHYLLDENEIGSAYRFNDDWYELELVPDTILVKGRAPVIGSLKFTRFGPVLADTDPPVAIRWTAHDTVRTLAALDGMHRARNVSEFQSALRLWDSPMQNILVADASGDIAIRSTGRLPIRRSGSGAGLLDGSTDAHDWIGYIPFKDLPFAENPPTGFLTSTNQQPAGRGYPYYLGHDWYRSFRSIRIDSLLRSRDSHSVKDVTSYQSDVFVVQMQLFRPMIEAAADLTRKGAELKELLLGWDGFATVESAAPLAFLEFLDILEDATWDEFDRDGVRRPRQSQLYWLLSNEPESQWLDIRSTELRIETAPDLVRLALNVAADSLEAKFGWDTENWRWGDHHGIMFRHLTRSEALRPLWRGPFEAPGFAATLAPAEGLTTTFGASWRMVVDFSAEKPVAIGIYPGGQSGNPASRYYDLHLEPYMQFSYYQLRRPKTPDAVKTPIARYELEPGESAAVNEQAGPAEVGEDSTR